MKHGCMVMTLRLSSSSRSGSRQIHRGRKKRVKFAAMSSPVYRFSTSKVLSTRNSYPLVKLSMASFTVRFWSSWGRAFGANVQTSGRKTIGFSTMTTRLLTYHSLFDNSWLPKTLQWFPIPPIRLTSPPVTFSYSPRGNYAWRGVILTRPRRSTWKRKRLSTYSHLRTSRDAWNHGKHAGITVYMPKGATSEETVETRSSSTKLFFMVKFPKFLGSSTYCNLHYTFPSITSCNYKQLPSFSSILIKATCQFNITNKSPSNLSHAVNYDYVTWNLQEDCRITQHTSSATCSQNMDSSNIQYNMILFCMFHALNTATCNSRTKGQNRDHQGTINYRLQCLIVNLKLYSF